jgi:uncharacterized protein YgiM (DUF1202 family)
MKMLMRKKFLIGAAAVFVMTALVCADPIVSHADTTGTVTTASAVIREKADTSSNAIGSSTQGATVTIKAQTTDASGTLWYQVYVDANTLGYIRADLISAEGEVSTLQTADTSGSQTVADDQNTADSQNTSDGSAQDNAGGASVEAETAMDAQYASVSVQAAKIRKGPSTDEGIVETLAEGTQVVVSGKSGGSDGKDWYYVTFNGADGSEKTGFVRYDLVSLGDMLPEEEETTEQPVEETEQTQDINNDFELKYEQDDEGGYAWYLYDNRDSQVASRQKLEPLLEAVDQAMSDTSSDNTAMVVKQRIVIVVLVVLAVALAAAVIIMAFKLRDAYYEDYDDDEEEEEPEEPVRASGARERSKAEPEKRTEPKAEERTSARRAVRAEAPVRQRVEKKPVEREVTYEEEPDVSVPVKSAPKRKSKNFLLDDDEFEFEFLNMDEKDLQ